MDNKTIEEINGEEIDDSTYYAETEDVSEYLEWNEEELVKTEQVVDTPVRSAFSTYLHEIGQIPLLTAEDEKYLFEHITEGQNKTKIIEANLRLVVNIAKRFQYRGIPLEDLVNEGNIGLMKAVERFKVELGFRFSTYAFHWIKQAIARVVAYQGSLIRIPVHQVSLLSQIESFRREIELTTGVVPTDEEIMGAFDLSEEDLRNLNQFFDYRIISLETTVGDDGDTTIGELIPSDSSYDPAYVLEKESLKPLLNEIMSEGLNKREIEILTLRFGLDDNPPKTSVEVCEMLGLSRERLRMIESKALRKLRHPRYARVFRGYVSADSMKSGKVVIPNGL